jgi:DMSO/TMAO reductase YedYZ molybdopterin-dependent catalytic subunit
MAAEGSHDPSAGAPYGRRAFVGIVATGVASLWLGPPVWRTVSGVLQPAIDLLPPGLRAALPAFGTGWRIYTINPPMPRFAPDRWRLRIDGLVEHPRELSYHDLLALPRAEQTSDFHCVTGWSVPGVHWAGVRFADLLAEVKPLPSAHALTFFSAEHPYNDSLTLAQALSPDAMLAYEMDGEPLTRDHGAPARLVMPQMYGYKGVKWVAQINLTSKPTDGYWEDRGYDRDARIGHSNGLS